jgi:hypothetical protein
MEDVVTGTIAGCKIGVGKVLAEEAWHFLSISDIQSGPNRSTKSIQKQKVKISK